MMHALAGNGGGHQSSADPNAPITPIHPVPLHNNQASAANNDLSHVDRFFNNAPSVKHSNAPSRADSRAKTNMISQS